MKLTIKRANKSPHLDTTGQAFAMWNAELYDETGLVRMQVTTADSGLGQRFVKGASLEINLDALVAPPPEEVEQPTEKDRSPVQNDVVVHREKLLRAMKA
jgi:hypothetical protein